MTRTMQLGLLRNKLRILTYCWWEADESTMTVKCPHLSVDSLLCLPEYLPLIQEHHAGVRGNT